MKINVNRMLADPETQKLYREIATQLNGLSEGRLAAKYTAYTAAPTNGTWAQGDKLPNSAPTELGLATAKYVIDGWICVAGGIPGTWLEQRTLTGN